MIEVGEITHGKIFVSPVKNTRLEIKTVCMPAKRHSEFDTAVNELVINGWELLNCNIVLGAWHRRVLLIAQLKRTVEIEEE